MFLDFMNLQVFAIYELVLENFVSNIRGKKTKNGTAISTLLILESLVYTRDANNSAAVFCCVTHWTVGHNFRSKDKMFVPPSLMAPFIDKNWTPPTTTSAAETTIGSPKKEGPTPVDYFGPISTNW
jgi:hypothetical protein